MERHRYKTEFLQNRRNIAIGAGAVVVALSIGIFGWQTAQHQAIRSPETAQKSIEYPVHNNIRATVFWVGEAADDSNDYIPNHISAWSSDWVAAYGGVDDPEKRCGYAPCAFTPRENPFYFALPFSDYTESGPRAPAELAAVPWYTGTMPEGTSILKNRWIEVAFNGKKAYAQWEDVGPFEENDPDYVFGNNAPKEPRAGLDMSPGLADYLNIDGSGTVNWRFVDAANVPDGPWKETVTRSNPTFN